MCTVLFLISSLYLSSVVLNLSKRPARGPVLALAKMEITTRAALTGHTTNLERDAKNSTNWKRQTPKGRAHPATPSLRPRISSRSTALLELLSIAWCPDLTVFVNSVCVPGAMNLLLCLVVRRDVCAGLTGRLSGPYAVLIVLFQAWSMVRQDQELLAKLGLEVREKGQVPPRMDLGECIVFGCELRYRVTESMTDLSISAAGSMSSPRPAGGVYAHRREGGPPGRKVSRAA